MVEGIDTKISEFDAEISKLNNDIEILKGKREDYAHQREECARDSKSKTKKLTTISKIVAKLHRELKHRSAVSVDDDLSALYG